MANCCHEVSTTTSLPSWLHRVAGGRRLLTVAAATANHRKSRLSLSGRHAIALHTIGGALLLVRTATTYPLDVTFTPLNAEPHEEEHRV